MRPSLKRLRPGCSALTTKSKTAVTAGGGFTNFNRYFFAQVDKQAAIIDERFNHGGFLADYIVENLRRPVLNRVTTREGKDMTLPAEEINGPKVMIINQFAGSGG